jgi:hypothetical protein
VASSFGMPKKLVCGLINPQFGAVTLLKMQEI